MEDDENRDDEEKHRRERVPRPQLQAEVLAGEDRDVGEVAPHASASRSVASPASRPGAWLATSRVFVSRSSASSRSSTATPASSRPLKGSSRSTSSGS